MAIAKQLPVQPVVELLLDEDEVKALVSLLGWVKVDLYNKYNHAANRVYGALFNIEPFNHLGVVCEDDSKQPGVLTFIDGYHR